MPRDDGRKLSFSERDKKKRSTSSTATRADRDAERRQEKLQGSQAYQDYKRNLEKVFGGEAPLPGSVADSVLDPGGAKAKSKAALDQLKKLESEDRKRWIEAAEAFCKEFDLPDDAFLADGLLDHPRYAVQAKAMSRLEVLAADGKLPAAKRPRSLVTRLKGLQMNADDEELKARAKALLGKLL